MCQNPNETLQKRNISVILNYFLKTSTAHKIAKVFIRTHDGEYFQCIKHYTFDENWFLACSKSSCDITCFNPTVQR